MEKTKDGLGLGRDGACVQMWTLRSMSLELRGDGRSEDDILEIVIA